MLLTSSLNRKERKPMELGYTGSAGLVLGLVMV